MKGIRSLATMLVLSCAAAVCHAQDKGGGALLFEEKTFDFGSIEEAGGPVSHSFAFVNTGGKDVFLTAVIPSCSCTTAGYEAVTVHPGGAGEIKVTYDPAMLPGQFRQNVLVKVSDRSTVRLYVEGVVRERDKGIDEQYPYFLTEGLQSTALKLRFGFIPQGSVARKRFAVVNTSSSEMKLEWKTARPDPGLKVDMPSVLPAGQSADIILSYDITPERTGTLDNDFTVSVAGRADSKPVRLEGFAVYTTRVEDGCASLRFEPTMMIFKRLKHSAEAVLYNDGAQTLRLIDIELTPGVSIDAEPGTEIPGGGKLPVKVRLDRKAAPLSEGYIRLFTNDPARPVREIIIKQNI